MKKWCAVILEFLPTNVKRSKNAVGTKPIFSEFLVLNQLEESKKNNFWWYWTNWFFRSGLTPGAAAGIATGVGLTCIGIILIYFMVLRPSEATSFSNPLSAWKLNSKILLNNKQSYTAASGQHFKKYNKNFLFENNFNLRTSTPQ